jgi:hypothetical protein
MRKLLIGILALAVLVGCNDAKKTRGTANARGTRSQNPDVVGGTAATLQALNCTGDSWGLIFDDGTSQVPWNEAVKIFGSASVNYQDIGDVSGQASSNTTGISFCGRVCTNPQYAAYSEVYIGIWDSKFLAGEFDSEISVNIKNMGRYNGKLLSGSPNTKFQDDFGNVEFIGASQPGGTVAGQFCFTNGVALGNGPKNFIGQRICMGRFSIKSDNFWRRDC